MAPKTSDLMTLTIYVQDSLVSSLPTLAVARKVNDKANVVFQVVPAGNIFDQNILQWSDTFTIAATQQVVSNGTIIATETTQQPIEPNQVCDWNLEQNGLLPATPAPGNFPTGSFGTVNLPDPFVTTILCPTANTENVIFIDEGARPGLIDRPYIVSEDYIVSWERDLNTPGMYAKFWTDAWSFSFSPISVNEFISFGSASDGGAPQWWNYGSNDPGQHDPSKAQK